MVPQEDTLDPSSRSARTWSIYGALLRPVAQPYVRARADRLLEFVQLADRADSKVEPLSGGMKRRLTIARSLINEPELLLLDEPTTGLDPQARHVVWERLFRLKQQGVTLVLTTHYMDEAEQLCDRLVVMDDGRIAAEGSPGRADRRALLPRGRRAAVLGRRPRRLHVAGARRHRRAGRGAARPAAALRRRRRRGRRRRCTTAGLHPTSVLVRRSTLEDVFLRLTGRTLVD